MKRWTIVLAGAIAWGLLADAATAQPPGGGDRQRGQRPGGQGVQRGGMQRGGMQRGGMQRGGMQRPDRGQFMRMLPLMVALDTDKDGEISAEEIKNAAKALKTLDKNKNGKLDADELRPQMPGPGGPGRPGGPGGGRPGPGAPGGERPGPGGPSGGGPNPEAFVKRIMGMDKNKDGKVSKDELPTQMQRILNRADTDGDDAISEEEAKKMAEQFMRRSGGAGRGGAGGRPAGGRPGGERGERPQRPEAF